VSEAAVPDDRGAWSAFPGATGPDDEYEALAQALRDLQDAMTAARAPAEEVIRATEHLRAATEILKPFEVREREQVVGHRGSPGRAQAMSPRFFPTSSDRDHVEGRVMFGRFYLGGNGAVHGGAIPLLFDEVLGRLANTGGRAKSRTAFMNVDYRAITPIGVELTVRARFDSEEGRKRLLSGEIVNGDVVCAEAHGLFVALRPGQP
jgi:acyl-coenzyme A thioesterase PaaI-like protein